MTLMLFTITVTALLGSSGQSLDALEALASRLGRSGILDAAVTMGSESVSFTGQIEAAGALEAVNSAAIAMRMAGFTRISAVTADICNEEDYASNNLRIAVA